MPENVFKYKILKYILKILKYVFQIQYFVFVFCI